MLITISFNQKPSNSYREFNEENLEQSGVYFGIKATDYLIEQIANEGKLGTAKENAKEALEKAASEPDFWNDKQNSDSVFAEINSFCFSRISFSIRSFVEPNLR